MGEDAGVTGGVTGFEFRAAFVGEQGGVCGASSRLRDELREGLKMWERFLELEWQGWQHFRLVPLSRVRSFSRYTQAPT